MKKRHLCFWAALLLLLILSFSVSAQADLPPYQLDLDESYTVVSAENTKEAAGLLGISEQQFSDYRAQNAVKTVAAKQDGSVRICLNAVQNPFSQSAKSFLNYEKKDLEELLPQFLSDGISGSIVTGKNQLPFFRLHSTSSDTAGTFTVTQYLTVCENTQFSLLVEADEAVEATLPDRIFQQLSIGKTAKPVPAWLPILTIGGIILFAVIGLWCLIRILQDLRHPQKKE